MTLHPDLARVLKDTSRTFFIPIARLPAGLQETVASAYLALLPEVTLRIGEWLSSAPPEIAPRIWDATIAMAERMAYWVENHWRIQTEADLDGYTFSVAGAVGLLICDLWGWFDGTPIDRKYAIQFGRGLQAVNILRNRKEDAQRGVSFFPAGWTEGDMFAYARKNIEEAKAGARAMPKGSFKYFVEIPLLLAEATLGAMEKGRDKLSREQVMQIVGQV